MDTRIQTLASMMKKTGDVMASIDPSQHGLATPCDDYDVGALLGHVALWVQVFDAAVHETKVDFDPMTHVVECGWNEIYATSCASIIEGLETRGFDREMTMVGSPMPGEFILSMLLMEYVGHGWDFTRALGVESPHTDEEAGVALAAARAIVQPEHRAMGMFGDEIEPAADAPTIDRFMAFLGRNPSWSVGTTLCSPRTDRPPIAETATWPR